MKEELKKAIKEVTLHKDTRVAIVLLQEALYLALDKRDRLFQGIDTWSSAKQELDDLELLKLLNSYKYLGPPTNGDEA